MAIHLQELPELVEGGGGDVGVLGLAAGLHVGVRGPLLRRVQLNSLTAHKLLEKEDMWILKRLRTCSYIQVYVHVLTNVWNLCKLLISCW